jgi:Domain of unknown function (DUF4349)
MPSPDLIASDRLEELMGGALPEAEREARLQGLIRELRADAPAAPAALRARVRALEAAPVRRRRLVLPRRRTALAFAGVLLAAAGLGSAVLLSNGSSAMDDSADVGAVPAQVDVGGADMAGTVNESEGSFEPQFRSLLKSDRASAAAEAPSIAPTGRATDVSLWMEVRLPDADELSAAAAEAMAITRELGGRVAASDIDTEGSEGSAELALRVPVGQVEDAVVRLGDLGTVTGERVATVDLQTGIDRRADKVEQLERKIRVLELKIESGTLTPEEELNARLQIERHRNAIDDLERANLAAREEAATAELALALHTRQAAAKQEEDEGGAAGAARDALDFLGTAGAIALFLAIVLSPVILLVVLLWLAFRARSRRVEARLLDRPDPASPPST